jgi:hypothetical protein
MTSPARDFIRERYADHAQPFSNHTQRKHDAELRLIEEFAAWLEKRDEKKGVANGGECKV